MTHLRVAAWVPAQKELAALQRAMPRSAQTAAAVVVAVGVVASAFQGLWSVLALLFFSCALYTVVVEAPVEAKVEEASEDAPGESSADSSAEAASVGPSASAPSPKTREAFAPSRQELACSIKRDGADVFVPHDGTSVGFRSASLEGEVRFAARPGSCEGQCHKRARTSHLLKEAPYLSSESPRGCPTLRGFI